MGWDVGCGWGECCVWLEGVDDSKACPPPLQQKGQLNTCHLPRTVQKQQQINLVIMLCYSVNPRKVKISWRYVCINHTGIVNHQLVHKNSLNHSKFIQQIIILLVIETNKLVIFVIKLLRRRFDSRAYVNETSNSCKSYNNNTHATIHIHRWAKS